METWLMLMKLVQNMTKMHRDPTCIFLWAKAGEIGVICEVFDDNGYHDRRWWNVFASDANYKR